MQSLCYARSAPWFERKEESLLWTFRNNFLKKIYIFKNFYLSKVFLNIAKFWHVSLDAQQEVSQIIIDRLSNMVSKIGKILHKIFSYHFSYFEIILSRCTHIADFGKDVETLESGKTSIFIKKFNRYNNSCKKTYTNKSHLNPTILSNTSQEYLND